MLEPIEAQSSCMLKLTIYYKIPICNLIFVLKIISFNETIELI